MTLLNRIYTNTRTAVQWMIIEIHGDMVTLWNCHSHNSETMELNTHDLDRRFQGWLVK